MATIESYVLKSGAKRYRVRYTKPDRKPTDKRGFKTKKAAQDWLAENTVKMNAGEWRPAAAGKITVHAAAKTWLETKHGLAPKTVSGYRDGVRHLEQVGTLGQTWLRDVDAEGVEKWVSDMRAYTTPAGKQLAPKTIRNSFGVLSSVMKRAVRDKRIPSNPCEGVELPRVEKRDMAVVPTGDVAKIATAAGDYGDVVRALAMSGLRWGEMAGLQVQDVNLETRRLRIRRQVTEDGGRLIHGLPKHGKRRTVPIVLPLADILEKWTEGKPADALVFTTRAGTVLRNRNARRDWFDDAVAAAGYPGLTPHELRHTFASVAISAGANVKALQQALGHHSAAFTLDVYGHLFPDDLDGFVDAMTSRFA